MEQENDYFFHNAKIRNIFGKYLFIKKNNKNQKIREFTTKNFEAKKNLNFNDIESNIQMLYDQYNLMKELEDKKQFLETNPEHAKRRKKIEEKMINVIKYINELNQKKEKENETKPQRKMKVSTNFNLEDVLLLLKDTQKYDQLVNGFGGYYSDKEEKQILQKMKESNPNEKNIQNIYHEIKTNIIKEKEEEKILKRISYKNKIQNNSILNRAAETIYNNNKSLKNNNLESNRNRNINNDNNYNDDVDIDDPKQKGKKFKKKIVKQRNNSKQSKQIRNSKKKFKDRNTLFDNKTGESLEENSFKEEEKTINGKKVTAQEKDNSRNNKTIYNREKELETGKEKDSRIKKFIEDNKGNKMNINKKKFNIEYFKKNKKLNDFEKNFIIKTNFLSDLKEKDKEQILKYLEELEELSEEEEISIPSNRTKINNLHSQLKNFIFTLFKTLNKAKKEEDEKLRKRKTDFFYSIKNKDFLEKQKKIMELKEEEEENEQNFIKEFKNIIKEKRFSLDPDLEIIFEKQRKRSRSFNIKMMRSYPKLYHNLLFNFLQNQESLSRAHTPKKDLLEDEWEKYLMKTSNKRRNLFNVRVSKFVKRKRKPNKNARKSLFVDEYKDVKNKVKENDGEIDNIKDEIKRNKLKKELLEKKLYEFFDKIQALKKGGMNNYEKELEILIDERIEKLDYTKAKENESRVNNFIQEFDLNRTKNIFSKKYHSKRMHYLSPIIFFTKQNEEKNNNKQK